MQVGVAQSLGDIIESGRSGYAVSQVAFVIERILHGHALRRPFLLVSRQQLDLTDAHHVKIRLELATVEGEGRGRRNG